MLSWRRLRECLGYTRGPCPKARSRQWQPSFIPADSRTPVVFEGGRRKRAQYCHPLAVVCIPSANCFVLPCGRAVHPVHPAGGDLTAIIVRVRTSGVRAYSLDDDLRRCETPRVLSAQASQTRWGNGSGWVLNIWRGGGWCALTISEVRKGSPISLGLVAQPAMSGCQARACTRRNFITLKSVLR